MARRPFRWPNTSAWEKLTAVFGCLVGPEQPLRRDPAGQIRLSTADGRYWYYPLFDSTRGWLLDNFEGLTHHRNQRFFLVSDDNCSRWQNTLLVYFELLPASKAAEPG